MDLEEAIGVVGALADGVDPTTGEVYAATHPFNQPQVIRALFEALHALERVRRTEQRKSNLPANTSKTWNPEDDRLLIEAFDSGVPLAQIAANHHRTEGGIAARLVRLGKIKERAEVYLRPRGGLRGG